ncbi:MAG: hypothetical protein EB015_09955 [Methylocystaceae bacterium]|nr:hypothetical protein [Methylocystaceae bacterium]
MQSSFSSITIDYDFIIIRHAPGKQKSSILCWRAGLLFGAQLKIDNYRISIEYLNSGSSFSSSRLLSHQSAVRSFIGVSESILPQFVLHTPTAHITCWPLAHASLTLHEPLTPGRDGYRPLDFITLRRHFRPLAVNCVLLDKDL